MDSNTLYNDISRRTAGDIYIGVVGPVRTGKSTFIKRFMEALVVPHIEGEFQRQRAVDELPQSAAGRTIMTAEPKFIPDEAVSVMLSGDAEMRVKMIDCVGYIVPSALGYMEQDTPRMVRTPWFSDPIPFNMAAEVGTKKVITDHSTIGIVITTDGSFGELPRNEFAEAEERVIRELKELEKPFVVIVNSAAPEAAPAKDLAESLAREYDVPTLPCNCATLNETDIRQILETVLFEFPIKEIRFDLPAWVTVLDDADPLKHSIYQSVLEAPLPASRIRSLPDYTAALSQNEYVETCRVTHTDLAVGASDVELDLPRHYFYDILSQYTQTPIRDDGALMETMVDLCKKRSRYDRYGEAVDQARKIGYGVVMPDRNELELEEPELIKQEGRYGVRLRASAPSLHMINAKIETEVTPIIGTESQSEEFANHLLQDFKENPSKIWDSDVFGRSLYDLVNDGLRSKLTNMPDQARDKYKETLERIINEGSDGLICIIV